MKDGSKVRILIADDFAQWRVRVREILRAARPEWQIICETLDGFEAVQKTAELLPDVVVLDIGMPRLNGIEAAKRIRQNTPTSKVVFLTQNCEPDVQTAALETSATGYVLKSKAQELVSAIEAALRNGAVPISESRVGTISH